MATIWLGMVTFLLIALGSESAPFHSESERRLDQLDQLVKLLQMREQEGKQVKKDSGSAYVSVDMSVRSNQVDYFQAYGYMPADITNVSDEQLEAAITKFQTKWNLQITGQMNTETQTLMELPRCGCPDFPSDSTSKRYSTSSSWTTTNLTYNVMNASSTLNQSVVDDAIERALDEWSNVTPLTFTKTLTAADLDVFFVSRGHEDGYAFDGPGNVLAHAFFPAYGGDSHYDDDENWTIEADGVGIDLFIVAVHEFGHALGLGHSDVNGAVMYPYYRYQDSFALHSDDIAGIQSLYGGVDNSTEIVTTTEQYDMTTETSGTCLFDNLDAITSDKSGNIFIFHEENYTLVDHKGIVDGFPRMILDDFPEISGTIDAAVYLPEIIKDRCRTKNGILRCYSVIGTEEVFVFAGLYYYRYATGYLESKRMKQTGLISDKFQGFPQKTYLDAAFTYDGTDIYLVSGDLVYKQIRGEKTMEGPVSLTNELVYGMPVLNDVLSLPTTSTFYNYFFVDGSYYRTTNGGVLTDNETPAYPRDISRYWCDFTEQNNLGYFKHNSVFVEINGDRIFVPEHVSL